MTFLLRDVPYSGNLSREKTFADRYNIGREHFTEKTFAECKPIA